MADPPILSYRRESADPPMRLAAVLLYVWAGVLALVAFPLILLALALLASMSLPGIFLAMVPAVALARLTVGTFRTAGMLWRRREVYLGRAFDLCWQFEGGMYIFAVGVLLLALEGTLTFLFLFFPLLSLALVLSYTRRTLRTIIRHNPYMG